MPIARFQMPDGRIARFEVPEGTTADQLSSFAAQEQTAKSYGPDFSRLDDPSLMDSALSKVRIPEPIQWLAGKARALQWVLRTRLSGWRSWRRTILLCRMQ